MSAIRSRHESREYKAYLKTLDQDVCVFCTIDKDSTQFVSETKYSKVITNIFPYSLWEGIEVVEHLMLTPKKHISSLAELGNAEAIDYMKLLQKYEKMNYNLYARAPSSPTKSIPHQHTHLIKTRGAEKNIVISSKHPKIRILL